MFSKSILTRRTRFPSGVFDDGFVGVRVEDLDLGGVGLVHVGELDALGGGVALVRSIAAVVLRRNRRADRLERAIKTQVKFLA